MRLSSASGTLTPFSLKSWRIFRSTSAIAFFCQVGLAHRFDVGVDLFPAQSQLTGCPLPQQPVAARFRLELKLLIHREFLLIGALAIVKSGHFLSSIQPPPLRRPLPPTGRASGSAEPACRSGIPEGRPQDKPERHFHHPWGRQPIRLFLPSPSASVRPGRPGVEPLVLFAAVQKAIAMRGRFGSEPAAVPCNAIFEDPQHE